MDVGISLSGTTALSRARRAAVGLIVLSAIGACSAGGYPRPYEEVAQQSEAIVCTSALLKAVSATASSQATGYPASNAIDGSLTTRWASAASDPQWIYVDYGAPVVFNEVKITWNAAYSTDYEVDVANVANSSWTKVYAKDPFAGGVDNTTGLNVVGRYLRVYAYKRDSTTSGDSIYEIQAYGSTNVSQCGPCTPGASECVTSTTVETCSSSGKWNTATACSNHGVCVNGSCETQLAATAVPVAATVNTAFSGTVAHITDALTSDASSALSATITWGDGASSAGTVSGSAGSFTVSGTHTYKSAGTDTIEVTVEDAATGATASTSDAATVSVPPYSEAIIFTGSALDFMASSQQLAADDGCSAYVSWTSSTLYVGMGAPAGLLGTTDVIQFYLGNNNQTAGATTNTTNGDAPANFGLPGSFHGLYHVAYTISTGTAVVDSWVAGTGWVTVPPTMSAMANDSGNFFEFSLPFSALPSITTDVHILGAGWSPTPGQLLCSWPGGSGGNTDTSWTTWQTLNLDDGYAPNDPNFLGTQ